MEKIWARFSELFSPSRIGEEVAAFAPNFIVALLTFAVLAAIWWAVDRALEAVLTKSKVEPTAAQFTRTVVKYAILTVATVTALGQVGINTASILTSLGIVGLTIGFAARDALSNTISGLFIFWDRPFVIGDLIEVEGRYGRVDNITMRSTRIVTPDGKMLAVPNTTVASAVVTSYTNFPRLRLDVSVTIAPEESVDEVRRLLLELVVDDPDYVEEPAPEVVVVALNDYNVELELRAWLDDEQKHVSKRLELRERALEALQEAGVEMPYETLEVWTRTLDADSSPPQRDGPNDPHGTGS